MKKLVLAGFLSLMVLGNVVWASDVRAVGLQGAAVGRAPMGMELDHVPGDAACFDLDLLELKTDRVIGTAVDCLSNINEVGDGLALTGTTFFHFNEGTLVSRGLTSVQPVTHGSVNFTHITGAVPEPTDDSVIWGDGRFSRAHGPVRLSGAVNLSRLVSHGEITFDCVFLIRVQ
jgi:hypothetical protein